MLNRDVSKGDHPDQLSIFDNRQATDSPRRHQIRGISGICVWLDALTLFDQVFNVIEDRDADIAREAIAWARQEGKLSEAAPELQASLDLSDTDIEKLIAERDHAKKTRNFARADAIRNDLAAKGILLEDTKDGVRWKRK